MFNPFPCTVLHHCNVVVLTRGVVVSMEIKMRRRADASKLECMDRAASECTRCDDGSLVTILTFADRLNSDSVARKLKHDDLDRRH